MLKSNTSSNEIPFIKTSNFDKSLLKWEVGEQVVYPSHGVGEIVSIESNELFGPGVEVYVLELLHSPRRVLIPAKKAETGALRSIVSQETATEIIESLKLPPSISRSIPWTKRQRILTDKLSSSCLQDVADVLRELYHMKLSKELSFSQRRLFDTAVTLIVEELSIALKKPTNTVESEIRELFKEELDSVVTEP